MHGAPVLLWLAERDKDNSRSPFGDDNKNSKGNDNGRAKANPTSETSGRGAAGFVGRLFAEVDGFNAQEFGGLA